MTDAIDLEELVITVKSGSVFESLKSAKRLASLLRKETLEDQPMKTAMSTHRDDQAGDDNFEELIRKVKSGSMFESLSAAKGISALSRARHRTDDRFDDEEFQKTMSEVTPDEIEEVDYALPRD